ncbi:MAG: hypothetical protein K8R54_01400 [Bacteroidales bacterium]|nr:hypothetical protein [Bacteroidales bacterium]
MTTITVNDKYIETIKSFTDIETATNIAFKRYVIDLITTKLMDLSTKDKIYKKKYNLDFEAFAEKVATNEDYISELEQKKDFRNWEDDLIDWKFNYKGIKDWKQKLQNILAI